MRSALRAALVPAVLAAVAACGDDRTAVDPTLGRDLRLASTAIALAPTTASFAPIETAPPTAEPEAAPRPRAARSGPRRVASARPTATAAPSARESADGDAESAVAVEESGAAADEATAEVADGGAVALPRPAAGGGLPQVGTAGDGGYTRGPSVGSVIGVVLRGGAVGGIDDCVPMDRRRRPRGTHGDGGWPASRPPVIDSRTPDREPIWRSAGRSAGRPSEGRPSEGSTSTGSRPGTSSSGPIWRRQ